MVSYSIEIDGESKIVTPYNIDDINIKFTPDDKVGAWHWLYEVNEVLIGGIGNIADYEWLYDKIIVDKCRMCYLNITCESKVYAFKFNYYTTEFDLDNCIMTLMPKYHLPNYEKFSIYWSEPFDITENVDDVSVFANWSNITYDHSKKIIDILYYICSVIGCGHTSSFLHSHFPVMPYPNGSFDPPFDNLSLLDTDNVFQNLCISQSINAHDAAIELSLEDLMSALCLQHLNLRWSWNEDLNYFTLEHYKYFNNSLSYNNPPIIGIDATIIDGGKWLNETNNYKIQTSEYASQERWITPVRQADILLAQPNYGYVFSWRFWYNCAIPSDIIKKINTSFETNIYGCEAVGDSQILLMACDDSLNVYEFFDDPRYIVNFPFQSAIIHKFWMWDRPYPLGHRSFNQADFAMESTTKSKINSIELPMCCEVIDPYKLVKTDLGDGYIEDYELNLSTGMVTFALKYEDI